MSAKLAAFERGIYAQGLEHTVEPLDCTLNFFAGALNADKALSVKMS